MLKKNLTRFFAVAMLLSIATFSYADDAAPVYDADNFPPQFDGQTDSDIPETTNTAPPMAQQNLDSIPAPHLAMSLDQRIARAEQQISNLQSKDVAAKVDTLQTEIQALRGQVEQLTHQLQQAQKTLPAAKTDASKTNTQGLQAQVDLLTQKVQQLQQAQSRGTPIKAANKKDVLDTPDDTIPADSKVSTSKTKTKTTTATQVVPVTGKSKTKATATATATNDVSDTDQVNDQQPNVAEEQQIYQTAYDLIKAKKYNEAISALQKMLQKYPSGQFAANAHYWLGELYGLLGKNDQSAVEFGHVVTDFPDSPKVADAQLKLGLIFAAQFKWVDAKGAFKKVINHYPGTASARLASEQLKQIKEAGH